MLQVEDIKRDKNKGYIYQLICPLKNEPIYVGKSIDPALRKKQHESSIKTGLTPLYKYLRDNKIVPLFKIVEEVNLTDSPWDELGISEKKWISQTAAAGYTLLNSGSQTATLTPYHKEYVRLSSLLVQKVKQFTEGTNITAAQFIETAVEEKVDVIFNFLTELGSKKIID